MYLGTYDILGIAIALISALGVLAYAIAQNTKLHRHNMYLRRRNLELAKRLENSVERPF